VVSPLFILLS
jgi:hypothetical protein